ncbi:NACHT and WD repeat domain-containing protein 2-like [Lingula anatina]|uniref:NACHT and WD repeat domain-containing protein 2-like n=1 Tax=Lingula anatina TaxID=7574 RepID=A0A1S3IB73_LINAN|nr:NACHT and WD repeat domain-containing protein 2-like [Lingula anatina]|eukprot:XP_013395515.1 NACHT and WD repeat domain-containing protein 2-like [Lingula anatina]
MSVVRLMEDINGDDEAASQFSDIGLLNSETDQDFQKRLSSLWTVIENTLSKKNRYRVNLPWNKIGLNSANPEHSDYLLNFGTAVTDMVENAIFEHLPTRSFLITGNPFCSKKMKLYQKVLVHTQFFLKKSGGKLYGCQDVLSQIQESLSKGAREEHYPIFIRGPVGCGKSSILARIPSILQDICSTDVLCVMRSVGLTLCSSTPKALLLSICLQLQHLVQKNLKLEGYDFQGLLECYHYLLQTLSQGHKQWLILLDGIDLLTPDNPLSSISIDWLLFLLPHRVHVIMSYTSESNRQKPSHISQLERKFCVKVPLLTVPMLLEQDMSCLIKDQFSNCSMCLSPERKKSLQKVLFQSGNPLHAWTLCEAEKHKTSPSIYFVNSVGKASTLHTNFTSTLDRLEEVYSLSVIQSIVTHITLSVNGLTEVQLLDILSRNDEVLFWCFPQDTPTILRFPHLLWTAIRFQLEPYLSRHQMENKSLFIWKHSVYADIIKERYLKKMEVIRQTHCNLAMSFMDTSDQERPLLSTARGVHFEDRGNRMTSHQPLVFNESQYNTRKLNGLWIHLLFSGDVDQFKEHTFCNFEYLMAKLHLMGVHCLINELQYSQCHVLDPELYLVWRSFTKASETLSKDFLQMPSELIGRLRKIKDVYTCHTSNLIMQCMQWCDNFDLPILVPLTPWLVDPRSPLVTEVDCPEGAELVAIVNSGQHVFYTTTTYSIQMRHLASKKKIMSFEGHSKLVTCLCLSHDNKFLVSGSQDCNVHIWDIATGDCTDTYRPHDDTVLCLALNTRDDILVTGGRDFAVHVISLIDGAMLFAKCHHAGPVSCVCLNANDTILVTASLDKTVKMWSMDDMTLLNSVVDLDSPVITMDISVDSIFLLMGLEDGIIEVRSFTTGTIVHNLDLHRVEVSSLCVSKDSQHVVVGCKNCHLLVYNLRTRELLHEHYLTTGPVSCVKVTQDEFFIVTASKNTISVWNFLKSDSSPGGNKNHSAAITCMAMSPDGKTAITGSRDCTCILWNLELSEYMETLKGHEASVSCVALSVNDAFALSGSKDGTFRVWNKTLAIPVVIYKEHQSPAVNATILPDNIRVLTTAANDTIHIWKADTGETLFVYRAPNLLLIVSPSGKLAISGNGSHSLRLWSVEDGRHIQTLHHNDKITCVTFSADSEHMVTGSTDHSLKIWEAKSGKLTQVLVEHTSAVLCVAMTTGSIHIVSGSEDRSVLVWGMPTGEVEYKLEGHTQAVTAVKVTEDGGSALSGSLDCTLRLWSIIHGCLITLFDMHHLVVDLMINSVARRIIIRLDNERFLPVLCLHNSPVSDVKCQSQISLHMANSILPIHPKPLPPTRGRLTHIYPTERRKNTIKRVSLSTLPEIIRMSPIRAPVPAGLQDQKTRKMPNRTQASETSITNFSGLLIKEKDKESKKSKFCTLL